MDERLWLRRAQPLLGTLVDIGVARDPAAPRAVDQAIERAFARIRELQRRLSRFDADSDIGRFHALRRGDSIEVTPDTQTVLRAALDLQLASDGLFDISLGTGPNGWRCVDGRLTRLQDDVRLDLGGIGKGYAVDCAVQCLLEAGATSGWVNAGGDLRGFGDAALPIHLRDERSGGVRAFATLRDGAFATSWLEGDASAAHVSIAAPQCLWADALTKVIARSGDARHPLLARFQAQAWLH